MAECSGSTRNAPRPAITPVTPFVLSVGGAAAEVEGRFLPDTIIDPPPDREEMDDDLG